MEPCVVLTVRPKHHAWSGRQPEIRVFKNLETFKKKWPVGVPCYMDAAKTAECKRQLVEDGFVTVRSTLCDWEFTLNSAYLE